MGWVTTTVRRVFVGKTVGIVFGVLLAGTLLIPGGFLPTYLAVLFASGIRNVYLSWLGDRVLFDATALLFLYFEAVVVTAFYLGVRYLYRQLRRGENGDTTAQ